MDFLLYWFARGVIAFFAALPLNTVARIGRGFGAIAYALDRRHREVALNNLRLAFGTEKPEAELKGIARENFRRLGENYCCAIKTAFMSEQEMAGHLEVTGVEHLQDAARAGENIVVAIGHFGNFEVYARTKFFLEDYTFATTYRALRQPSLTRLMQHLRSRSGCVFFERRTEAEALKLALKKGRLMVGFLADQHAGRSGVWIPFFGRDCSTTAAPAVLALRYEARLFTAVCYRKSLARWEIVVGPEIPLRDNEGAPLATAAIMSEVNQQLEAAVRRDPANWFWVHKRWKPADKRQARETSADAVL